MYRSSRQASLLFGLQEVIGALIISGTVLAPAYAAAAESEAIAWLKVGDNPAAVLQGGNFQRNAAEYEQFRKTQAALIKSPDVLRGSQQPSHCQFEVASKRSQSRRVAERECHGRVPARIRGAVN